MTVKRHLFLMILAVLLMSGCGASRRVARQTFDASRESTHIEAATATSKEILIDTTKTESGKVTITEITFAPGGAADPADTAGNGKPPIPDAPTEVVLPGGGKVKGNGSIQSIKQTIIESQVEQKGESREAEEREESGTATSVAADVHESSEEKAVEAPKPNRLKYAFYILALAVCVLMYLKRMPILNKIRSILSGLRKIIS